MSTRRQTTRSAATGGCSTPAADSLLAAAAISTTKLPNALQVLGKRAGLAYDPQGHLLAHCPHLYRTTHCSVCLAPASVGDPVVILIFRFDEVVLAGGGGACRQQRLARRGFGRQQHDKLQIVVK